MKPFPYIFATALLSTALIGCTTQHDDHSSPEAPNGAHTHADGSTHDSHDGQDAAHNHGHSHSGELVAIGEVPIFDITVEAKREGEIVAGQEAVIFIDTSAAVEAVRLWIGDEEATNSIRVRADGGPTSFHAHTMVPDPLMDGFQLWVEVQKADGERASVAFDLTATATDNHSHGGESHSHDGDAEHDHSHDGHSHDHGDHDHSH